MPKTFKRKPQINYKQIFCLLLIIILALVTLATNLTYKNGRISTKAFSEETYNLILELKRNKDTNVVTVTKATINDGYSVSTNLANIKSSEAEYMLKNDVNVILAPVDFEEYYISETAEMLAAADTNPQDPRVMYDMPTAYVSIPYTLGQKLFIEPNRNAKDESVSKSATKQQLESGLIVAATQNIQTVDESPDIEVMVDGKNYAGQEAIDQLNNSSGNLLADNYLDVLYISSHYTDMSEFQTTANRFANTMINFSPLDLYSQRTRFIKLNNVLETGCQLQGTWFNCDVPAILQIASSINYDLIIVIEDVEQVGGNGFLHLPLAIVSGNVDANTDELAVHEVGHSLFQFSDEVNYGVPYPNPEEVTRNCDVSATCPKWAGMIGTTCTAICGWNNAYRSSPDSIMRGSRTLYFSVYQKQLIKQTYQELGIRQNPGNI